jgi:hypothetical protein
VSSMRAEDRIRADEAWVRWTYDPVGWARITGGPYPTPRGYLTPVAVIGLCGVAFVCGGEVVSGGFLVALAASIAMAYEPAWWLLSRDPGRRTGGEVRIGPTGVIETPGGYTRLNDPAKPLAKVRLDDRRPARIEFLYYDRSYVPQLRRLTVVPVPEGHLDEARALVERFTVRLPVRRTRPATDPDEPFGRPLPPSLLPD